jgi:hypothetical protein
MKTRYEISHRSDTCGFHGPLLVVLFLLLPHDAAAQQASALDGFLGDPTPALLFEVTSLSLEKFSGGIGIWYSVSENFHWSFVLSPSLIRRNNEQRDLDESYTSTSSSYRLELTAAPIWILDTDGDFCFTAGPVLSYSLGWWTDEYATTPPGKVSLRQGTDHSITTGVQVGAGYALTPSLLLHLQYRMFAHGGWRSASGTDTRSEDWVIDSIGLLSLGVRL